jgi:hypothetical protein
MAEIRRFDPREDALLQRALEAIRRSQELIEKARDLQRQSDQLKKERRQPQTC